VGEDKGRTLDRVIELKLTWGALVGKTEEGNMQEQDTTEKSILGIRL